MQTNFTPEQLQNPRIREAEKILRSCVHCGFCTATCSTYVILGDERDSPRGRIYLMKDMFEGDKAASAEVTHHVDRCLSCLSCVTTCPSGVDYMHLVDLARTHIEETHTRPLKDRLLRKLLGFVLPYPGRFRASVYAAKLGRPFAPMMAKMGLKEVSAMLALAPKSLPPRGKFSGGGIAKPRGQRLKRVSMLPGCAQQVLRPEINDATIRVLARHGVEVVVPSNISCCGALVHHMGREHDAHETAKHNVDAWLAAAEQDRLDAIVINASGCGTVVKDYGHMLQHDPVYAERGRRVSEMTKDITEFLTTIKLETPHIWTTLRVAYHSACSMQHGQKITTPPRKLLKDAGFTVLEIPEGHICCGSAGTYNIMQPELATQLRDRKLANTMRVKPDLIATGNIGCITQLQTAATIPVVHTIELLDWAYGGPVPRGLEALADRVKRVGTVDQPAKPLAAIAS